MVHELLRPVYQHARKVNVEVVVGPHAARQDLHPHAVALAHPDHGGLPEGVVLEIVWGPIQFLKNWL